MYLTHPSKSFVGTIQFSGGAAFTISSPGQLLSIPDSLVLEALRLGLSLSQARPVVTTGQRPVDGLAPGMELFDATLGKPIWRNAGNTAWVDATGASV